MPPKTKYIDLPKSKGILDDFPVRKNIATRAGTITKVPVDEIDIVNKKYVDDNAVSDHSALTNLNWFAAGHIMDDDIVFENGAARSVKIDDALTNRDADDLNILAGNTVFHVSSSLDGGNVNIDGGVAQGPSGNTGDVKIANTRGKAILADGSKLVTSAAPNADAEIANKKYVDDTAGAGGAPGGSDTQVQFNDAGAFGGDAGLTYNKTADALTIARSLRVGTSGGDQILGNDGTASNPTYSFASRNIGFYKATASTVAFADSGFIKMLLGTNLLMQAKGNAVSTAYTWNGDTNTGMFRVGNDSLGFAAGAIELLRLDEAAQNVVIFNETGLDIDFRIETLNEPNFFFIDGADNTLRIGDMDTNYMEVDVAGKILFTGASGLAYGEIYVNDNATVTSVSSAGFTQFLHFTVNGHTQNTSPDHTNDHITITKAGVYMVDCCVNIKNDSGSAHDIEVVISKNNNATIFPNLRRHRTLGTGTDIGAIPLCGHISLAVNDTLEVWITSDSASARDVIAEDVTLMLTQVGGN